MEIQHSSHEHPLVLRPFEDGSNEHYCENCSRKIFDFHYVCHECKYYLHFSCAVPFLRQMYHPIHSLHSSITFQYISEKFQCQFSEKFQCQLCRKVFIGSSYMCDTCRWSKNSVCIDIYCALTTPTATSERRFWDIGRPASCHNQPMEVVEVKKYIVADQVMTKCYICELSLSSSSQVYTCKICKYFFHKSCFELPYTISHPVHLRHCMNLITVDEDDNAKCNLCDKPVRLKFIYRCDECKFYVCVKCLSLRPTTGPTVMYQDHDHLLYLLDKVAYDKNIECRSGCYTDCKQLVVVPSNDTERYIFRCDNCNFSLHFLCGPLPCVIKHNCHLHPLTLYDSTVEDDSGEYYCDACETERDPRTCVYYCEECKYVAHVHCVISEVVRVLQSDHRDVELRIVGQRKLVIEKDSHKDERTIFEESKKEDEEDKFKPKILLDIINSIETRRFAGDYYEKNPKIGEQVIKELQEMDQVERNSDYQCAHAIMNSLAGKEQDVVNQRTNSTKGGEQEQEKEEIEENIQEFSSYSHKSFEELLNKLKIFDYPTRWNKVNFAELQLKLVNVGGYMITWNLAHVLKDILAKYGDISSHDQKMCSPTFKNLTFFILCRLLYRMSRIMVVDVSEDLLGDWYSCLRFVNSKGFNVDFIYDGLQQIVRAYIGLRRNKVENAIKTKLGEMIATLEAKVKIYKEYREEYEKHGIFKSHRSSETTNYSMEEFLDEASKLKWKFVGDCLF